MKAHYAFIFKFFKLALITFIICFTRPENSLYCRNSNLSLISIDTLHSAAAVKNWNSVNTKGQTLDGYDTIGTPPTFSWAKSIGFSSAEQATAMMVDSMNNAIYSVTLSDSMDFLGNRYHSLGGQDILIFSSAIDGPAINWVKQIHSDANRMVSCSGIIAGKSGGFYATGTFTGEKLYIENKILYRSGITQDFWLARFDNNGNWLWAINVSSAGTPHIAIDSKGAVYLTGNGTFNKYDKDGNLIWSNGHNTYDYQKITISDTTIFVFGLLSSPDNFSNLYLDRAQWPLFKVNTNGDYLNYVRIRTSNTPLIINSIKAIKNKYTDSTDIFISGICNSNYFINIYWPHNSIDVLYPHTSIGTQAFMFRLTEDLSLKNSYESNYNNFTQVSPMLVDLKSSYPDGSIYLFGQLGDNTQDYGLSFDEKSFNGSAYNTTNTKGATVRGGFSFQWIRTSPTNSDFNINQITYPIPLITSIVPAYTSADAKIIGIINQASPMLQLFNATNNSLIYQEKASSSYGTANIRDVQADPDCNQYISGTYFGSVNLFGKNLNGNGSFVAKTDVSGNIIWCDTVYGGASQKLALDKDGNIWNIGIFSNTLTTSHGDFLINESGTDFYLIKYDKTGKIQVCKQFNGSFYSGGNIGQINLTTDKLGNPVFSSLIQNGKIIFDQTHVVDNPSWNAKYFIVKTSQDGNILWNATALNNSDQGTNDLRSLAVDSYNNIFGTGSFRAGSFSIQGTTVNTRGVGDMFLFKLSPDGKLLWLKSAGGATQEVDGYSVCTDKKGNSYVYCNGFLTDSPYYFDETIVTPPTGWIDGILFAKYSPLGNLIWVKHFPANKGIWCSRLLLDEKENLYLFGGDILDSLKLISNSLLGHSNAPWFMIKCNPEGIPSWAKTFGKPSVESFNGFIVPIEDRLLFFGNSLSENNYDNINITPNAGTPSTPFVLMMGKDLIACDVKASFAQVGTILCANDIASGKFTVSGGTPPYSIEWKGVISASNDTLTNLQTNKYYGYRIQDLRGCSLTDSFKLIAPQPIQVEITTTESELTIANGTAMATVNGGVAPYTYLWSNGSTNDWDTAMAAGAYSVKVTDANSCEKITTFNINNLNAPKITLNAITNNSCNGGRDGAIGIDVSSGTPPYKFKWSNGSIKEDVNNLPAGIYDVLVIDSKGLIATATYVVHQPDPIDVTVSIRNPDCGNSDGSAQVFADGGNAPYKYLWSNGDTLSHTDSLHTGIYSIMVTDKNGCRIEQKAVLSEIGAPEISVNFILYPNCGDSSGIININTSGGSGKYSYLWSTGTTDEDLIHIPAGDYIISVIDTTYKCTSYSSFKLEDHPPLPPAICIVSVDSATGYINLVINKDPDPSIQTFNIYEEGQLEGQYNLIGTINGGANIFIDSLSNSNQRSWKYKVSAVDPCGNESDLSQPHKTIHLTMNLGLSGSINLIWNKYEGFAVGTYDIWRYSQSEGWKHIDQVPGDVTSYTDFTPPAETIYYFIEAQHPTGCTITTLKSKTLNSTRSNRTSRPKSVVSGINLTADPAGFNLYPNPSSGSFTLSFYSGMQQDVIFKLVDSEGRVLQVQKKKLAAGNNSFDWIQKGIAPGLYSIMAVSEGNVYVKRLVIE